MIDKEILRKTIEKAVKNGFKISVTTEVLVDNIFMFGGNTFNWTLNGLIFSHDFAKAFWGERNICLDCLMPAEQCDDDDCDSVISWQYHLQQVVLEKDPIKYLEQFL